ncbi:MAG: cytochrome c3 family protein [Bacteroidota bacterium]
MKKLIAIVVVFFIAGSSFAQITGSAHDFSGATWNASGEICIVCHTPHNAEAVANAPLWNHEIDNTTTYTVYSSNTMDATVANPPDGGSKLCLSCHDGAVALDNFGGATGGTNFISTGLLGTDLSNDHPVSFTYDDVLAGDDGGLADPLTVNSGLGGTIDEDMLKGGKLQCSSCHDAHNAAGLTGLLLKSNAASDLCLTCHIK